MNWTESSGGGPGIRERLGDDTWDSGLGSISLQTYVETVIRTGSPPKTIGQNVCSPCSDERLSPGSAWSEFLFPPERSHTPLEPRQVAAHEVTPALVQPEMYPERMVEETAPTPSPITNGILSLVNPINQPTPPQAPTESQAEEMSQPRIPHEELAPKNVQRGALPRTHTNGFSETPGATRAVCRTSEKAQLEIPPKVMAARCVDGAVQPPPYSYRPPKPPQVTTIAASHGVTQLKLPPGVVIAICVPSVVKPSPYPYILPKPPQVTTVGRTQEAAQLRLPQGQVIARRVVKTVKSPTYSYNPVARPPAGPLTREQLNLEAVASSSVHQHGVASSEYCAIQKPQEPRTPEPAVLDDSEPIEIFPGLIWTETLWPRRGSDCYRLETTGKTCAVCGDRAIGKCYGVPSCNPCRGFFSRILSADRPLESFECKLDCPTLENTRGTCARCRVKRCLAAGMRIGQLETLVCTIREIRRTGVGDRDSTENTATVPVDSPGRSMDPSFAGRANVPLLNVTTIHDLGVIYVKWLRAYEQKAPSTPVFDGFSVWDQWVLMHGTALEHFILRILRFSQGKKYFVLADDEECYAAFLRNADADGLVKSFFKSLQPLLELLEDVKPTRKEYGIIHTLFFRKKFASLAERAKLTQRIDSLLEKYRTNGEAEKSSRAARLAELESLASMVSRALPDLEEIIRSCGPRLVRTRLAADQDLPSSDPYLSNGKRLRPDR